MAIDVRRFLTEYCQLYCGTPALDVHVVHLPTAVTANHAPDPLTGNPPLETRITVQIRQDASVGGEGIDLGEAITETMAAIEKFSRPVTPLPIDIYRVIHTVSGQEVSEAEFIAAYPAEQQATAASGLLAPYSKLARGIVGEYLIELYTSDDPATPPLLYAYGSDGDDQFHLLPPTDPADR
ncbi:hypothetical protein D2E71_24765 [Mycobacteroides abscessus]|uniref:hypothetical protein n=1 Tax=Mycobacteroides abscessus TaxID=36809 RepID=UPI000C25BA00|nr:hypothetical protein [Mycobacteroides abscessus]RIS37849.1 hypothetical protein D2E71_24765 [Mycobacteroides abscessus]